MGILPDWKIREENIVTPFEEGIKRPGVISYGLSSYGYDIRLGDFFQHFGDNGHTWPTGMVDPKNTTNPLRPFFVQRTRRHKMIAGKQAPGPDGSLITLEQVCLHCGYRVAVPTTEPFDDLCLKAPDSHKVVVIMPGCRVLAESFERLKIPRSCQAIVHGKSTYARCGLIVNCTPLEPEWEGKITLTLINPTRNPIRVCPGEGIAQVVFHTVFSSVSDDDSCRVSYADKDGKYQNAAGAQTAMVDGPTTTTTTSGAVVKSCDRPPAGWYCTRGKGHEGPCAARKIPPMPRPTPPDPGPSIPQPPCPRCDGLRVVIQIAEGDTVRVSPAYPHLRKEGQMIYTCALCASKNPITGGRL